MHVACDAAESHHHILSYLKIDLPAFVCVCALVLRHRPGGCLLPFIHAHFPSHAALTLMPSCSRNEANTRIHVLLSRSRSLSLSHTRSPSPSPLYIRNPLSRAHLCPHGLTHRSTQRWLCKWSYSTSDGTLSMQCTAYDRRFVVKLRDSGAPRGTRR